MEIQIKAYAYTIDIITEIRYFCKCNNAVFGKFRFIFTCAISKTDCSLHHNFHALFKISGNEKFVRTAVLTPHPSRNLRKSTPRPRPAPPHQPFQKPHYPLPRTKLASLVKGEVLSPERIRATTGGIATPTFRSALTFPKPHYPSKIANTLASLVKGELLLLSFAQPTIEGLPHRTLSFPQPLQKDNNPSPHICPFIQYVNLSQVCSPAHSSAFETASPQDRYKAQK